ncbi:glycosyltransferase [Litchfieldia salsa]|uniref:Glycosyltransferase involved in cell wall bisynthesis n=1 Tax=Litchfieldia salsa TaxID=930152 RepID=A0A1H0VF50_9BACI|nr:glycosyltransferase [Litchfieldia salsa]SDP76838.1 Glycosyltransferase involved in cell wall bisynthesis [Litchfieldia salsa]
MNIKVSVIVPVFNAEEYLTECINSLLNQTLQDCEFIFINDGSTDKSKFIIENYRALDSRIKLINQENQGVSTARNNGLRYAYGEYIGFVDADDFIEKEMYEVLYYSAKLSNCDMVFSNFKGETEGRKVVTRYQFPSNIILNKTFIQQDLLPYFLKEDNLNTVCTKIYKSKIVQLNNVTFPNNIELGEDGMFNMHFLSGAKTVKYIDYIGYHYREVKGSATRNISEKDYFKRAIDVYNIKYPEDYYFHIDKEIINKLKSIKLIKSVISYIHLYFNSFKELSFNQRYSYIKKMIRHENVRNALPIFYGEFHASLGRYEKFILEMINKKFVLGLYFATTYSRLRSK